MPKEQHTLKGTEFLTFSIKSFTYLNIIIHHLIIHVNHSTQQIMQVSEGSFPHKRP